MIRLFPLISIILLTTINSSAQSKFQRTFGGTDLEQGYYIEQTTDSGYVMVGFAESFGAGDKDFYLVKTDSDGNMLWSKTYGGVLEDWAYSVHQTNDGGYILVGFTESFGAGNPDVYLVKTDAQGNLLWSKTFGGTDFDIGYDVQQTADNGYIITGYTLSYGFGNWDVYLIKTDVSGNLQWTKTYGGAASGDQGRSVRQTTDGGYIIAGETSYGAGINDIYLLKVDATGNLDWTKTYGGTNGEEGYAVQQTTDEGYIIIGYTNSFGAGNADLYLIKTDSLGNLSWSKTYGGASGDWGRFVQQTPDGGYILTGEGYNFGAGARDAYLIKTDANGNALWSKAFGGVNNDYGLSVENTIDNGYILAGITDFGAGIFDIYMIKTDSLGNTGCNEVSFNVIVNNAATQVNSGGAVSSGATVSSPVTIINNPPTIDSLLCGTFCNVNTLTSASNVSCNGFSDGTAITTPSNGTAPYTFLWDANTGNQTDSTATGLAAGTYYVTITDNNGCTTVDSVTITEPIVLTATISDSTNVDCFGNCNGTATVTAGGGTPTYTYLWPSGGTNANETGLCAGTFTVTVTDTNGCTVIDSVNVYEPTALSVTLVNIPPNAGDCNGSMTANVTGGTPTYLYQWDGNAGNQTTQTADSLCAGEYCVTITDANSCTLDTCVTFTVGIYESSVHYSKQITIHPNPTTGVARIMNVAQGITNVEVFDVFGRQVPFHFDIQNSTLDIRHSTPGIYFVKVGETVRKLVKQ